MDILGIGFPELIFIMIIAMMVFGPRRLPEIAAKAGKIVADLRNMSQGMMAEWQREISAANELDGLKDLKNTGQELLKVKDEIQQAKKSVASSTDIIKQVTNSIAPPSLIPDDPDDTPAPPSPAVDGSADSTPPPGEPAESTPAAAEPAPAGQSTDSHDADTSQNPAENAEQAVNELNKR